MSFQLLKQTRFLSLWMACGEFRRLCGCKSWAQFPNCSGAGDPPGGFTGGVTGRLDRELHQGARLESSTEWARLGLYVARTRLVSQGGV